MRPYRRNAYRQNPRSWIEERYFTLSNFSGGLNNVEPDNEIADNELTDCCNMRFMNDTIMEKRSGSKIYDKNLTTLNEPISWLDIYNPSLDEAEIIRATDNAVYSNNDKICDVEGDISGVTYIGKYYFVDGHNLYVWDRDTYYRIVGEPISHVVEESGKDTQILIFDKLHEAVTVGSEVMILSSSLNREKNFNSYVDKITKHTNGNTIVHVTNPITGDVVVNTPIFFYKPKDSSNVIGDEVWDKNRHLAYYKPCENEIGDAYAGESYFPDSPSVIAVHNSRLFIAGDSKQPHGVYMSRTAQPLYFPSNAGITVKPDNNPIVDLVVFDGSLVIGRHNDIYVLYGSSEYQTLSDDAYYIKQMDVSCGFMSKRCGALLNNFYIYLGYDGIFYKLNTPATYVEYLMTSPLPHKCDIYAEPFNTFAQNSHVNVYAVAYRNEVYFRLNPTVKIAHEEGDENYKDEFEMEDVVIVYSYDNMAFTYFTGFLCNSLCVLNNKLLIGRTDGETSFYCDDEEMYNDCGVAIPCNLATKRFNFINPISFKYFKQFLVTSYAFDNINSFISVFIEVDFTDIDLKDCIRSNLSRFDFAQFNIDIFNNRNLYKSQYYKLDIRGRTIKFKFSNNKLDESMRIYDFNVLYSMRDVR